MSTVDRDARLNALLATCLEALEQGRIADCQRRAVDHPEFADELADFLAAHEAVRDWTAPLRTPRVDADRAPPANALLRRLGDYELLEELGRGGMGVVFRARDERLGRLVAVKVLDLVAPSAVRRFRVEAEVVALLDHPNIVPIFEIGDAEGRLYFSMKFVDGGSLAQGIAAGRWPTGNRAGQERAVALVSIVARAIHYAHAQGVVHRDLKPANILLDSNGHPFVTDFGLARRATDPTVSGGVVGTPGYIAPEQTLGPGRDSPAADVYALGAILYELLTGARPFPADTPTEMILRALEGDPVCPRMVAPNTPIELETICLKCLERNPTDRYRTALDLADDLERWAAGHPIRARRAGPFLQAIKWGRRHPHAVRAGGTFFTLGLIGLVIAILLVQRERSRNAEDRAKAEVKARETLEIEHYFQTIALAERERAAGNAGRAERLLDGCPQSLRGWEWAYLRRARLGVPTPWSHDAHLYALAVSPDGERVVAGGSDGSVSVWNSATGRAQRIVHAHSHQIRGLAFAPDGHRFASAGWDGFLRVWEADGSRCVWQQKIGDDAFGVAFSPDNRTVAVSFSDGSGSGYRIARHDATAGHALAVLPGHATVVRQICFSPDGSLLASADDAGTVKVWVLATGLELVSFLAHPFMVFDLAFSHDGSQLATASGQFYMHGQEGEIKIWDTVDWHQRAGIRTSTGAVFSVAFGADGSRLASGGEDGMIRVWDTTTGREAICLRGHREAVWAVAFTGDGCELYSAGGDHEVRRWDARAESAGPATDMLTGHGKAITAVVFQPGTSTLASADMAGAVRIWDAKLKTATRNLPAISGQIHAVAFSPDGTRFAVAVWRKWHDETAGGVVVVFETQSWTEVGRVPLDSIGVLALALSPDGSQLVAACDNRVVVARMDSQKSLWAKSRPILVTAVAWSPDGAVVAADADGTIVRYEAHSGKELQTIAAHRGRVAALAFAPGGRRFASAGWDGAVHVWDTATWMELPQPAGHPGGAFAVVFLPDGRLLSGGTDGALRIWNVETGRELNALSGHTHTIQAIAVAADGQVATGGRDRTIRLWRLSERTRK